MRYKIVTVVGALIFSFAFTSSEEIAGSTYAETTPLPELERENKKSFKEEAADLYKSFSSKNTSMPASEAFERALTGYKKLEAQGRISNPLLTIVDFNLSSKKKRMWILNMETQSVLFNTYVAHGRNTGGEFATKFSNRESSHQSSLGFYLTGETYYGGNGLSLKMDGLEKGINSNARKRYIVIHGADYAEPEFIKRYGRLGRSYGCPSVPNKIAKELIHKIKGESVVYIHKDSNNYLEKSTFLSV